MESFSFSIEDYERPIAVSELLMTNRAFLYGEGATTCTLLRRGRPLFWEDHRLRLEKTWCSFYSRCDRALLRGKLQKNRQRLPKFSQDHYLKIYLFTNDRGREFDRQQDDVLPHVILYGGEYRASKGGLHLKTVVKTTSIERNGHKIPYYLPELKDRWQAKRESFSDILYVNPQGYVLESSVSNVFLLRGNQVLTPPLSPGILAGIGRKYFIKTLRKHSIYFVEREVHRSELLGIDGILLSNSLGQIMMASKIDSRELHCSFGGKLQNLYRQTCEEYFQ